MRNRALLGIGIGSLLLVIVVGCWGWGQLQRQRLTTGNDQRPTINETSRRLHENTAAEPRAGVASSRAMYPIEPHFPQLTGVAMAIAV